MVRLMLLSSHSGEMFCPYLLLKRFGTQMSIQCAAVPRPTGDAIARSRAHRGGRYRPGCRNALSPVPPGRHPSWRAGGPAEVAMARIGISDVAAAAGVSASTVSVVLNNVRTARVHPATRERIWRAATDLGYVPNELARGL